MGFVMDKWAYFAETSGFPLSPPYHQCYVLIYLSSMYAVAQLVEVLRYKPTGRAFDSGWCHWYFSLM
jgi:hypothetical protein